jgi:hypothetical protein
VPLEERRRLRFASEARWLEEARASARRRRQALAWAALRYAAAPLAGFLLGRAL